MAPAKPSCLASFAVVALVVAASGSATPAWAERRERPRGTDLHRSIRRGTIAVARGTFVDGPRHTWRAIKARPVRYGAMLFGFGLAGAGAKAVGIDPAPIAVSLSVATWGWQAWKAWPALKLKSGRARLRHLGADVLWPGLLVGATAVGGGIVGHGGHGHGAAMPLDVAQAGVQTMVITIDIPTIVQHGSHQ
jgi:hypothetical protein